MSSDEAHHILHPPNLERSFSRRFTSSLHNSMAGIQAFVVGSLAESDSVRAFDVHRPDLLFLRSNFSTRTEPTSRTIISLGRKSAATKNSLVRAREDSAIQKARCMRYKFGRVNQCDRSGRDDHGS